MTFFKVTVKVITTKAHLNHTYQIDKTQVIGKPYVLRKYHSNE